MLQFCFSSLLSNIQKDDVKQPSEELYSKLSNFFDCAGMNNPLHKIYVTVKPDKEYGTTLFIFVMANLQKLYMLKGMGTFLYLIF